MYRSQCEEFIKLAVKVFDKDLATFVGFVNICTTDVEVYFGRVYSKLVNKLKIKLFPEPPGVLR